MHGSIAANQAGRRSWSLVWIMAAAQLVAWGTLFYAFAAVVAPMERDLGWSRATLNGALSLGLATWGLAAPAIGAWIDRRGARLVMTAGSIGGALLLFMWSRVESVWAFYVLWAGIGLCMASLLYEPAFAVVFSVFRLEYRRAITAVTLVGGFASTIFIPLTQMLAEAWGWRSALQVLGVLVVVFCALPHALLLKTGDGRGSPGSRHAPAPPSASTAKAIDPLLVGLAVWFAAHSAVFAGLTFHLIPLMAAHGLESARIMMVVALIGPMQVLGRLVLLALGARQSARLAGAAAVSVMTIAVAILLTAPGDFLALVAFAALYGLVNGITTILKGTAVPEYLGDARYAATNGLLTLPANLAKAASPLVLAWVWTAAGGPTAMVSALLVLCLAGAAGYGFATWRHALRRPGLRRRSRPPVVAP